MIYIALGANLPSEYGAPAQTLSKACDALIKAGVKIVSRSSIWVTAPVPFDPDIPYYHNAVIAVETAMPAEALLDLMLSIEADFGRVRSVKNAPRLLDLDLIAYHDEVIKHGEKLIVPHPRMHERSFVLKPLSEVNNKWLHPVFGEDISSLINKLPADQKAEILKEVSL